MRRLLYCPRFGVEARADSQINTGRDILIMRRVSTASPVKSGEDALACQISEVCGEEQSYIQVNMSQGLIQDLCPIKHAHSSGGHSGKMNLV